MATLSETLKRQQELISSGVGEQEAKQKAFAEARGSMQQTAPVVPTAPVQPVEAQPTPGVPPSPTLNINQQRLAENQDNRQAMAQAGTISPVSQMEQPKESEQQINARLGGFIQDNGVNSVQPLNALSSMPATAEPVKTKVEPTIDFNVSAGREQEIQDNIAKITQSNPSLLKDRNAYNQAMGYETADAGKKALLDTAFAGANAPKSQQDILNGFISGVSIPEQNTGAYRNAKFAFDKFNRFNSMTPTQLVASLRQGEIGTDMDRLLSQNPSYIQAKQEFEKKQKVDTLNNAVGNVFNGIKGAKVEEVDPLQRLSDKLLQSFGGDQTYAEAFAKHITENPKIVDYTNQLSNVNKQIFDQTELLNKAIKEEKAAKGDMPASALLTLLAGKYSEQNDYLATLNNTKNYLQADLKMATEMANSEYQAISKDIDNALSQKNAVISNLIQSQFSLATKQAEAEVADKIAREAMNDPYKAIPQMIDEYKKLGIPFTRSTQQIIQDFENSGKELSTYLSDLQKTIQGKPEYQKIQALQRGQLSDAQKMQMQQSFQVQSDVRNFNQQKELARLNKDLTREQFLFELENDPEKRAKVLELEQKFAQDKSLFDVLGVNVGTYEGNRGYDLAGKIGDPLPAGGNWKVLSTDTAGEQIGSMFIGGKGKKPYGNTVVMEDENGNRIRYSHLDSIGVKPGDQLGFGDFVGTRGNTGNVLGKNGEKLTAEQLKAGRGAHLDIEIKDSTGRLLSQKEQVEWLKSKKAGGAGTQVSDEARSWVNAWNNGTMDIETILTKIGNSKEAMPLKNEVIKAIDTQGGVAWRKENDPTVGKMDDIIGKLDSASKSKYLNTVSGTVQTSLSNFLTGGKSDLLSDLKSVIEGGTLQSLIDAKAQGATFGALSNEELKMLQATSSAIAANAIRDSDTKEIIGFRMSESKLKSELEKMKKLFEEKRNRMIGVGLRSTASPQNQNTNIGGTNQIQYVSPTGKTYGF